MMNINLNLLCQSDAEELLAFESENRRFFEKSVPGRGDDFYQAELFNLRHQSLLKEQEDGISHFYLIKNDAGRIAGRINLVDIDNVQHIADIGFRVGEAYGGKGIGNRALGLLLNKNLGVKTIHAKTTTVNYGSQKVLEKNGFIQTFIDEEEFKMNGQRMRFVHYVWEWSRTD